MDYNDFGYGPFYGGSDESNDGYGAGFELYSDDDEPIFKPPRIEYGKHDGDAPTASHFTRVARLWGGPLWPSLTELLSPPDLLATVAVDRLALESVKQHMRVLRYKCESPEEMRALAEARDLVGPALREVYIGGYGRQHLVPLLQRCGGTLEVLDVSDLHELYLRDATRYARASPKLRVFRLDTCELTGDSYDFNAFVEELSPTLTELSFAHSMGVDHDGDGFSVECAQALVERCVQLDVLNVETANGFFGSEEAFIFIAGKGRTAGLRACGRRGQAEFLAKEGIRVCAAGSEKEARACWAKSYKIDPSLVNVTSLEIHPEHPDDYYDGYAFALEKGRESCLSVAALKGYLDLVIFLVCSCDVDVNYVNCSTRIFDDGHSAIYRAASQGHLDIVKWLGGRAANLGNNNGASPLLIAAQSGHLDVVKWIAGKGPGEGGADVNEAANGGMTPLTTAAFEGHLDVVKWLAGKGPGEGGADVNLANNTGATPLYAAAQYGHLEVVQWLAGKGPGEGGADVNQGDEVGWTPLYIAAQCGHLDVVKWLG